MKGKKYPCFDCKFHAEGRCTAKKIRSSKMAKTFDIREKLEGCKSFKLNDQAKELYQKMLEVTKGILDGNQRTDIES